MEPPSPDQVSAPPDGSDFCFVEAAALEDVVRKLLAVVRDCMPARFGLDPVHDVHVLCPPLSNGLVSWTALAGWSG